MKESLALIINIVCFCRVKPLGRPRINKHTGSIYTPMDAQAELLQELANWKIDTIEGPIIVDIKIFFEPRTKKDIENDYICKPAFGDTDNLTKAIYDGLQHRKIIKDDIQIVGGSTYKIASDEDHACIAIYRPDLKDTKYYDQRI